LYGLVNNPGADLQNHKEIGFFFLFSSAPSTEGNLVTAAGAPEEALRTVGL
jgi:hypothetical protein